MYARDLVQPAKWLAPLFCATLLVSCGPPGGPASSGSSGGTTTVTVSESPTSITTTGTSTITATVSSSGAAVADGTSVTFSLSSSTFGTLSSATATTTGGIASVTFTGSGGATGTVTITAASGGTSGTGALAVGTSAAVAAGGVVFVSASPNVIGIQGSGQATTSQISFQVTDASGNPVSGSAISFTMIGPSGGRQPSAGGEYIGTDDGTPTTASGTTDSSGNASVMLTSGQVAGPVTVTATVTVGSSVYSSSSSVVSIGGGVPSGTHFTLGTSQFNLPGLSEVGATALIDAYVADRFGNYNVLAGTSVSFYTEAGAIDRSVTLDDTGHGQVTFRTQDPMPIDTAYNSTLYPLTVELSNMQQYDADFGTTYSSGTGLLAPNPRDGWVTVLAVVQGEEAFVDQNGNGLYDTGEPFTDEGEPFIDANDNGVWDPGEFYIDENGNGKYDGPNGVWDGPNCPDAGCSTSKAIWTTIKLVFTGNLVCDITPSAPFSILAGGNQLFYFSVHDQNFNAPMGGASVSITSSAGTLQVLNPSTIYDGLSYGPLIGQATLYDTNAAATPVATSTTVTLTATSPAGANGCSVSVPGTLQ